MSLWAMAGLHYSSAYVAWFLWCDLRAARSGAVSGALVGDAVFARVLRRVKVLRFLCCIRGRSGRRCL